MNLRFDRESVTAKRHTRPRIAYVTTAPQSLIFLRGHLKHLTSQGFEITLISSPGPELDRIASEQGVAAQPLPMARQIRFFQDLRSCFELWRILRRLRPQIVHCYTPKAGLLGALSGRLSGAPIVAVSVFGLPQMTRRGVMRRVLNGATRVSCTLADWVWCDSASLRQFLVDQRLCDSSKAVVLGQGSVNGIDASEVFSPQRYSASSRDELRGRYDIPTQAAVIGFVGRIAGDKGMRELAVAWRELRERYPRLYLLLVGPLDEVDPPSEEDRMLFLKDDRVRLAGMQGDVAAHLSIIDVFVNPSYREGFGVANLEASAMAVPVVSTQIPGCVDSVKDGLTGTLVPARDARSLARALSRYLDDAELRRQHGLAGRERVLRDFRPERLRRELERCYRMLLRLDQAPASSSTTQIVP